jgi:hypothetical protein
MAKMTLVLGQYNFSRVGEGVFSAPVTLPVGRTIVKVIYYHTGTRLPYSSLRIMRVKTGETPERLGNKSSTDAAGTPITVNVPITGDPIIRGGYRYYILVSVNSSSYFDKVSIVYRD